MDLPYAEDIGHYWRTSHSSSEKWIDKTKRLIESIDGLVLAEGFGAAGGQSAFMLSFEIKGDEFKVVFPILPSKTGNNSAAKIQAATLLHHDIKAKVMIASVLGAKAAFFSYLMLDDGRTASELAKPELGQAFPLQLSRGEK